MTTFKALRIYEIDRKIVARIDSLQLSDLNPGGVVIKVLYSSINYKDALAATGAGRILRRFPLVGGIDLAGVVQTSDDARYHPGDHVLVTGCGLSETHDGGFAEYARVNADWVVPLPDSLGAFKAMAIGTAGFTAAMAIQKMERNGQSPARGPVAVTGASGGVGSLAIDMLSTRGYEVVAITGKASSEEYLKSIGAHRVLFRDQISFGTKPLESAQFAGAVDNLGGNMLAWLTRITSDGGNIASIGLAAGHELSTTVMPFILRGVNLLGINAAAQKPSERQAIWSLLASDLMPRNLLRIAHKTIAFDELLSEFPEYMAGAVVGRSVVKIA